MRHPPYHLRPNKAADRFAFIEAIKRLERLNSEGLGDYIYYGLGGPYLEDFRLLYEHCPDVEMVSIENDLETYKRQQFHLPCGSLDLRFEDLSRFIELFDPEDKKSIFWLDFTNLEYSNFEHFKALLSLVNQDSLIKITLKSQPNDYWSADEEERQTNAREFRGRFGTLMPEQLDELPRSRREFAELQQRMVQIAAQEALPASADELTFAPVSSFYYVDSVGIFTLAGLVSQSERKNVIESAFAGWEFANLTWSPPRRIDVPTLSTKERLRLQRLLPSDRADGNRLREELGYLIDDDENKTEAALQQYADFHRYSPYLLRGVP